MVNVNKEWEQATVISSKEWDDAAPVGSPAEPSPMSPIEGASPWEAGQVPPAKDVAGTIAKSAIRHGIPTAAAVAAGSIPVVGPVAGPLAGVVTDMGLSKLYGEAEIPESQRETQFGADVALGMVPGLGKAAVKGVGKLIPAPLETKIANTIRDGFTKGVRPSVVGKSTFPQTEQYFKKAQSAVESIVENKPALQFSDDAGNIIKGQLPSNLNEFSQSIDQTKREIFKKYDGMLKASQLTGRDIDLAPVVKELESLAGDKVTRMAGGSAVGRTQELIGNMAGQRLTLSEAQDLVAVLNNRIKAFYRNPTPDAVGSAAADALAAGKLRAALDSAVEQHGYQGLKNQYGSLREIEKEVSNRAMVNARKNIKGLIDFADIASAAEAARAIATMNAGAGAAAGALKGMKELYKYINNPNRIVKNMFTDAEQLIMKRTAGVPMKSLPPKSRPMPGETPESYVRGVPANFLNWPYAESLPALPPRGTTVRPIESLVDYERQFSVRPQVR